MNIDDDEKTECSIVILQTQIQTIGAKFQQKAEQWLATIQNLQNFSAEKKKVKIHHNKIMKDLKQLNYERSFIESKLRLSQTRKVWPNSIEINRKKQLATIDKEYQKEFPEQHRQFTQRLNQKLQQKRCKLTTNEGHKPSTNFNWNISLVNTTKKRPNRKPVKKISNKNTKIVHSHGPKYNPNKKGHKSQQPYSKAKIEKLLKMQISVNTFKQIRKDMSHRQRKNQGKTWKN